MLALIRALHPAPASLNQRFVVALRDGLSLVDVLDGLRDAVAAFDALRTVLVPPPEGPAQRVLRSGEFRVDLVDIGGRPVAAATADALEAIAASPFDLALELPVRAALLLSGERPERLGLSFSHLTMDVTAVRWMLYQLSDLLAYPPPPLRRPVRLSHPLDRAAWESSPAGRHAGERALRHHEATLRALPQTMLPRPANDAGHPRFRNLMYHSPALALALPALASRHRVISTAVLYAGICAVAGYVSTMDRAFLQLTLGNRISPRDRAMAGMLTQDAPAPLDLAGGALPDLIEAANAAVLATVRFGQYPHDELAERRRRTEAERGVAFDLSCWLNDRRDADREEWAGERPDRRTLTGAMERARYEVSPGDETSTSTYFIFADNDGNDGDGDGEVVRLRVLFDATVLPPTEAIAWMRAVERVVCAALWTDVGMADVAADVGLVPDPRDGDWCLVDHSWVHKPTVAELVRGLAGASRADVFVRDGRLVAFLDGGPGVDLERLHADCVGALPGLRTAMAPGHYVVCAGRPTVPDLAGWRRLPVLAEGSGRAP